MASTADKAREALQRDGALETGEAVLAAAKAMPLGGAKALGKRVAPAAIGGLVGVAVAEAYRRRKPEEIAADFRNGVALVLTDRRLVMMSVTAMGANPKDVAVAVPIASITAVETGTTRVSLVKMLTITVRIGDEVFEFEVPKPSTKDAEQLVAALSHRIAA